jgi:hypothetical protein
MDHLPMRTAAVMRRPLSWTIPLVWAGWVAAVILVPLSAGTIAAAPGDILAAVAGVSASIASMTLVTSGAVLVTRLVRHPIGWLLWLGGILLALAFGGVGAATALLQAGVPGAAWVAWLTAVAWVPATVILTLFVPLLFPTGRLPSSRWRLLVIVAIAAVTGATLTTAVTPLALDNAPPGLENPIALGGPAPNLLQFVDAASRVAGIVCLPLVAASLVIRFQRSVGTERAQLKWFAAAAAPVGLAYAVGLMTTGATTEPALTIGNAAFLIVFVGLALLPVAIGIAVLRYRLYEIDRIISRTISYALVTAILVIVFGVAIVLLQEVLAPFTGGNTVAVAVSTLVVATLFQPLRRRVQLAVDRRFNRTRYDAARIEASFGARLRDEVDSATLRADLAATVTASVRPSSVGVWVRSTK